MRTSPLIAVAAATLAAAPALAQRWIDNGRDVRGALETNDPRLSNDRYYDEYAFRASRGEVVTIRMESGAIDPYLYLGREDGRFRELARDDDGGDGTDARLRYTIPSDGTYLIRASSAHRQTGSYRLALETGRDWDRGDGRDHPGEADQGRISANRTVRGYLDERGPRLDNGAPYHLYRYRGRGGERITIYLGSSAFDSYLVLGEAGGRHGVGQVLERDDDGGGNLDSEIRVTLPRDGEYVIRVNPVNSGRGRYTLELRSDGYGRGRDEGWDDDWRDGRDEGRIDRRLVGSWDVSELRLRGMEVRGTLAIRPGGTYRWQQGGTIRQGRLTAFVPRDARPGVRYYLLEGTPDAIYVFANDEGRDGGGIRLARRATGQVVARGRPADGNGRPRYDVAEPEGEDEVIIEAEP